MKHVFTALMVMLFISCSERPLENSPSIIDKMRVELYKSDKLIGTILIPEAGGTGFSVISNDLIAIARCPSPQYPPESSPVYRDFCIEILERKNEQMTNNKFTASFLYGGKDKPIGGYGKFQVYVSFNR